MRWTAFADLSARGGALAWLGLDSQHGTLRRLRRNGATTATHVLAHRLADALARLNPTAEAR